MDYSCSVPSARHMPCKCACFPGRGCLQERSDVLGCLQELKEAGFKQLNVLLLGKWPKRPAHPFKLCVGSQCMHTEVLLRCNWSKWSLEGLAGTSPFCSHPSSMHGYWHDVCSLLVSMLVFHVAPFCAGKSSVGKSSTVNSLLGEAVARVQAFKLQADAEIISPFVKEVRASS